MHPREFISEASGRYHTDYRCLPAFSRSVEWLVKAGFLREVTGNRRNRLFVSDELMQLMSGQPTPGTDPSSR